MARWGGVSFLVSAWLVGAADVRADEGPGSKANGTGALVGRVVDLQGRPVSGAEVWGVVYRDKVGSTVTDADGRFRLAPLKPDKPIDVWADARGFARQHHKGLHVFAGRDQDIGTLTLLPGTRIRGRVVDARVRPLAGARIAVQDYRFVLGHTIDCNQTEWTLTSGDEGRYLTPPLPAGSVYFRFTSPGKVRTFISRKAEPGTDRVDMGDVTLADEVPIRGTVVDQDGKPAPGVEVFADYDHESAVRTDKDGHFTVHGAGKDAKQLILRANDYFAPKPFDLGPGRDNLKIAVTKAYVIHGTAVDAETGKPVPIDTVRLCSVRREPDGSMALVG
jgi:protocatechuate 3,4-dioxygenase beta subunit